MATHSSVLAWRIPGTGEPGGLPSMGSHRVGHDRSDLAAAAAAACIYQSQSLHLSLPPFPPSGNYRLVCIHDDSIYVMKISSFVPFVQIPHRSIFLKCSQLTTSPSCDVLGCYFLDYTLLKYLIFPDYFILLNWPQKLMKLRMEKWIYIHTPNPHFCTHPTVQAVQGPSLIICQVKVWAR